LELFWIGGKEVFREGASSLLEPKPACTGISYATEQAGSEGDLNVRLVAKEQVPMTPVTLMWACRLAEWMRAQEQMQYPAAHAHVGQRRGGIFPTIANLEKA